MESLNKSKVKPILIISITLLILTSLRLLWLINFNDSNPNLPLAQQGILDLRDYEWNEGQTIALDGEWEFFAETLIDPNSLEKELVDVPREVVSVPTEINDDASYKYGTYRLQILLDENQMKDDKVGISIQSAETASALFVNGKLGGKSGEVGTNRSQHKGEDFPYEAVFTLDQNKVDIFIHVSNFDTFKGAQIGKTVGFVSLFPNIPQRDYESLLIVGMVAMLILHSLYTIFVYIFIYRKKAVLFFSIGFLLPAIDELLTYDKSILAWLHLDYDWSLKFLNLVYLGASFFYVQLMRVLLTNYRQNKVFQWYLLLYALSALTIVILPIEYLTAANKFFFLLYIISFFSVVIFALKEYLYNKKESFFLALAALSTTSGILWGGIKAIGMYNIPFYPFDYVFALIAFAAYWFQRYYEKERKLVEVVKELETANELKDEFLESNSQKLWNPLNEMITIAETMYKDESYSKSIQDKDDLKYLIDIGKSMSFGLVNLLDYTKLKEQVVVHPVRLSIQSIIPAVFEMLKYITDGKKIQIVSTISEEFPYVYADEKRFIQILFNLIHNATKYTNEGVIEIRAEMKKGMAIIHILDTGIGIDEKTREQILLPFEQENKYDEGIGLGLSVSKKLIELQGGTLTLQSNPNRGTEVQFTLPLAKEQESAAALETASNLDELSRMDKVKREPEPKLTKEKGYNILVIDDDPVNLKIISTILSSENYDVLTATTAKEALSLVDIKEWDLIILDAMMPYMSGYELARTIRKRYSVLELPILLLTVRSYLEDVNIGFEVGVNDYISKPINAAKLKRRVEALVQLRYSMTKGLYMEAAWLQAQIHPHFLFNTLSTIASLGITDTPRMIELINTLADYLRASFDMRNLASVVPLEHELHLVRSYLYIEKERHGDRLQVKWEIADNLTVEIPPLSIQPLVENAVRHGILKDKAGGIIEIHVTDHPEFIKISIKDDGAGMSYERVKQLFDEESTGSGGIGLLNTNSRLKKMYGQGLEVYSELKKGTVISFSVPKEKSD